MHLINVPIFILPAILFILWLMVGYAALTLLRSQRNILQNLLMAPALGYAIIMILTFYLNCIGLPVKDFSLALTASLFFASLVLIIKSKAPIPWSRYQLFLGVFVLSLFLTGWPLLKYGLDWISYGNGDFFLYCGGAEYFLRHGFFELPDLHVLQDGKEHVLRYWLVFVSYMYRCGSELMLAWVSGLMHLNPFKIYMSFALTLHMTLISVTGALICYSKKWRYPALITCLFLATSAMTSLGTLYQLIAQVGGISLLILCVLLQMKQFNQSMRHVVLRHGILISIALFAYLLSYPETSPFLALALIGFYVICLFKKHNLGRYYWKVVGASILVSLILINAYWMHIVSYIVENIVNQVLNQHISKSLFPYFMMPSGIANFWGLIAIPNIPDTFPLNLCIIFASLLSVYAIWLSARQGLRLYPHAIMASVMIIVGAKLYIDSNGFGLFKLAMYIQPFILGVLAVGICQKIKSIPKQLVAIVIVSLMGLKAQNFYSTCSEGAIGSPFVELPSATSTQLLSEVENLRNSISKNKTVIFDEPNYVYIYMLQNYFIGTKTVFLTEKPYESPKNIILRHLTNRLHNTEHVERAHDSQLEEAHFNFLKINGDKESTSFYKPTKSIPEDAILVTTALDRKIINKDETDGHSGKQFVTLPSQEAANHLVFISSSLGSHYYYTASSDISIYGFEKDYFHNGHIMAAIGRYLLFQLLNPSEKIRMKLDITNTYTRHNGNILPNASVVGAERIQFPLTGRGSARVFSNTFIPKIISNASYALLDMGIDEFKPVTPKYGLMRLFGNDVRIDSRNFTGYARDISLISEKAYQELVPPENIAKFPDDLFNTNLEYSGIYEDGWISESSYFILMQRDNKSILKIHGTLPQIGSDSIHSNLIVLLDDKILTSKALQPGDFNLEIPVSPANHKMKVGLKFSKNIILPRGDDRIVSAKLYFIGYH